MPDDQKRITVICSREFARELKAAITEKKYDHFMRGYKKIMELGLKEFKKKKEVKTSDA